MKILKKDPMFHKNIGNNANDFKNNYEKEVLKNADTGCNQI